MKTLNSFEFENIYQNIILAKNNQTDGLNANVFYVDAILKGVLLKLKDIHTHFAEENAIRKEENSD